MFNILNNIESPIVIIPCSVFTLIFRSEEKKYSREHWIHARRQLSTVRLVDDARFLTIPPCVLKTFKNGRLTVDKIRNENLKKKTRESSSRYVLEFSDIVVTTTVLSNAFTIINNERCAV